MNILQNKALIGAVTLLLGSTLGLLRALGVHIPETVDGALGQWVSAGLGVLLIIHGVQDAYQAPIPPTDTEAPNA